MAVTDKPQRGRPPERITVYIYLQRTMSDPREPIAVTWPKGWPIPEAGDNIIIGDKSGFVAYRQFEPETNKLSIVTR